MTANSAYALRTTARALRQLTEVLPESVAAAAWELATGPLVHEPHRIGKPLSGQLAGTWSARRGTYRLLYEIDEARRTVLLLEVSHRRDTYRRTS